MLKSLVNPQMKNLVIYHEWKGKKLTDNHSNIKFYPPVFDQFGGGGGGLFRENFPALI